VLSIKS